MRGIEGRQAAEGADLGRGRVGRLCGRVEAGALAGCLKLDDPARDRGLGRAQVAPIARRPPGVRSEPLGGLGPSPAAGRAVDAKRHPLALGEQRAHGHCLALAGGVEGGDLRHRVLAERIEPQALGRAALQQGGEGGRALLVVVQHADQKRPALRRAGEPRRRLEHRRRRVVGVVEHEQRRALALAGLGDGRKGGLGDLASPA